MNFSSKWDSSAAARWERWGRKAGKFRFVLRGGVAFGSAQMAANIPDFAIAWGFSIHALVAKIVLSIGIFAVLGALMNFATWRRMETSYHAYLSRT